MEWNRKKGPHGREKVSSSAGKTGKRFLLEEKNSSYQR